MLKWTYPYKDTNCRNRPKRMENPYGPIISKAMELIMQTLPTKDSPGQISSQMNSTKHQKKN